MNPAQLLDYFDRISDAPDAIPRFRQLILNLAVRGKLVEQCSQSEQVTRIYLNETTSKDLPRNWRLLSFGKCCDIQGGNQPPKSTFVDEARPGYVRLFQIRDLGKNPVPTYIPVETTNRFCREGEILIGRYGASVGKIFWAQAGAYNVALAKFIYPEDAFVPRFAFLVLESDFFQSSLEGATRSAQAGFNKGDLAEIKLPLPPLDEQNRIVAKVDELMDLCDRLETAKAERESRRDRLAAASHHHLNNGANAGAFHDYSNFYITHLQSLISRPDHIKELRQTILNFAVRGFLVPQDPNAEFAARMLGNRQLFLDSDAQPWKLPCGWAWSSFNLIGETLGGGTPSKADLEFWEGSIPWVSPKDMKVDTITDTQDHISEAAIEQSAARMIPTGSLLMVVRGMILAHSFPTALTAVPVTINQDMKAIVPFRPDLIRFLALLTKGLKPEVLRLVLRSTHGTCKLLTDDLFSLPIPIPPLAEQFRIVTRVDELMTLCDGLETQLTTAQTETSRLLEAVLHNALSDNSPPEELVKSAALK